MSGRSTVMVWEDARITAASLRGYVDICPVEPDELEHGNPSCFFVLSLSMVAR